MPYVIRIQAPLAWQNVAQLLQVDPSMIQRVKLNAGCAEQAHKIRLKRLKQHNGSTMRLTLLLPPAGWLSAQKDEALAKLPGLARLSALL